jgi:hypothetical protein
MPLHFIFQKVKQLQLVKLDIGVKVVTKPVKLIVKAVAIRKLVIVYPAASHITGVFIAPTFVPKTVNINGVEFQEERVFLAKVAFMDMTAS